MENKLVQKGYIEGYIDIIKDMYETETSRRIMGGETNTFRQL